MRRPGLRTSSLRPSGRCFHKSAFDVRSRVAVNQAGCAGRQHIYVRRDTAEIRIKVFSLDAPSAAQVPLDAGADGPAVQFLADRACSGERLVHSSKRRSTGLGETGAGRRAGEGETAGDIEESIRSRQNTGAAAKGAESVDLIGKRGRLIDDESRSTQCRATWHRGGAGERIAVRVRQPLEVGFDAKHPTRGAAANEPVITRLAPPMKRLRLIELLNVKFAAEA